MHLSVRLAPLLSTFLLIWVGLLAVPTRATAQSSGPDSAEMLVVPGDTWQTVAWRYGTDATDLLTLNGWQNRDQPPPIGARILVPATATEATGTLARVLPNHTPSLIALTHGTDWASLTQADSGRPLDPTIATYSPILIASDRRIVDPPPALRSFELSHVQAVPGQGMALRGEVVATTAMTATLRSTTIEPLRFDLFQEEKHLVGVRGTGAFHPIGTQLIEFESDGMPLWSQPWLFVDGVWEFQEITFTGAAAQIDNTAIADERVRMFALWSTRHPDPFWRSPFQTPIADEDIYAFTSGYGARRSYNGGPYSSYHEGVDYAAFEGVSALATTEGVVVLAEPLYVRGGSVVIDHGLGIFSGYYHLSDISVNVGDIVAAGEKLGEVGTTGLSTGNHLHWDFLVTETWVGADKWAERGMGCWLLEGLGKRCWDQGDS